MCKYIRVSHLKRLGINKFMYLEYDKEMPQKHLKLLKPFTQAESGILF